ncbi:APC family permease [Actinomycetospora sp. NBRC 106378]|uniref:APC family permease n=1 Tax=Actinomycetospora sp. NBRC 106378 TaxID=3032208 RepID=UPI0025539847|nr:APC family permease [Actinomycetospora sp. NBRC 106378]
MSTIRAPAHLREISGSPMSTTADAPVSSGPGLRRTVGFSALMFISLGSIIGSGWLLGALTAAKSAGGASILSWVLAGVIVILLALVHAELGSTYPVAGGTARYPRLAFGAVAGFTAGWVGWIQAVAIAPIEVEAALSYLDHLVHGFVDDNGNLTGLGLVVAAALMVVFTLINLAGVALLAETNRITVLWKIAIPVLTVIVLIFVAFHGSNFTAGGGFAPYGAHGVFAALPLGVVFALQGFEQAAQMGGEARDPQKDLPRALIGAVALGVVIYLALEVAFVGALDPAALATGWENPIGEGDFGPYVTIAGALGLTWLSILLYVDAFISPAGTGLVYVATSARLSYALGQTGFAPKGLAKISRRGIPWVSTLVAFVVGLISFAPFPSWQSLVSLVTSATVIMYGFAPLTLAALRKVDPDRPRPYRMPAATVIAPLSFIAANEIIYWSGWTTDWKLAVAIVIGFVLFAAYRAFRASREGLAFFGADLQLRSLGWILPWLGGILVISALGQYDGAEIIPEWIDLLAVAVWSLVIFYLAVAMAMPAEEVARQVEAEASEAGAEEAELHA